MRRNYGYYVSAFRSGNNKAIQEFISSSLPQVKRLVSSKFPALNADDIFQDALMIVIKKINEGNLAEDDMTASLETYIYAVAQNLCRTAEKSAGNKNTRGIDQNIMDNHQDSAEKEEFSTDEIAEMLKLVEEIKPPCNSILVDYYRKKLSYDEIAERYGFKNMNTARKKKHECLKKARILAASHPYFKSRIRNHVR
jgi:RNA polymerase sigma factor (sigma-70 family)